MIDIDKTYAGLQHAETSAYPDPFIRTVANKAPGGSTAFGPVQITDTLAKDYVNKLSPESQQFYNQVLAPKYELMRQNGNNKGKVENYNPSYDYGGNAEFDPNHQVMYQQFAKELLSQLAKKSGGDEGKLIELWRGKPLNQDPKYLQRYKQGKMMFDNEMIGASQ